MAKDVVEGCFQSEEDMLIAALTKLQLSHPKSGHVVLKEEVQAFQRWAQEHYSTELHALRCCVSVPQQSIQACIMFLARKWQEFGDVQGKK